MTRTLLNEGGGPCTPERVLSFRMNPEAAKLGAASDFFNGIFRGVHTVNRRNPRDERCAPILPGLSARSGLLGLGNVVQVFGSAPILKELRESAEVMALEETEIIEGIGRSDVDAADFEEFPGIALVRVRAGDRETAGDLARRAARDARAGRAPSAALKAKMSRSRVQAGRRAEEGCAHLMLGQKRLTFRAVPARPTRTITVSTYGLRAQSETGGFPVAELPPALANLAELADA